MRTRCVVQQWQRFNTIRPSCRFNSTSTPSQVATDLSSPIGAPDNPPDTRTHHIRQHGNRPLPMPPLMDPKRIAQRARHKRTKAYTPDPSQMSSFQQRLSTNPYATLLASPIRYDHLTQSRLPSALLLSFDIKAHPRANTLHLLPSNLWSEADPDAPQDPMIRSPRTYVSLRKKALKWVGEKKKRVRYVMNQAMVERFGEKVGEQVVWRQDMHEMVLKLLRRGVERKVKWLLLRGGRMRFVRIDGAEQAGGLENIACVLYVGSLRSEEYDELERKVEVAFREGERLASQVGRAVERRRAIERGEGRKEFNEWCKTNNFPPKVNPAFTDPRAEFPTVNLDENVVPVYSLEDLMGTEETEKLLKGTVYEDARCLAMRDGELTSAAQMWLLKLQAYLT